MLNEYWDKGMKSLSSMKDKEMAAEVMSATGLSYKQLKVRERFGKKIYLFHDFNDGKIS